MVGRFGHRLEQIDRRRVKGDPLDGAGSFFVPDGRAFRRPKRQDNQPVSRAGASRQFRFQGGVVGEVKLTHAPGAEIAGIAHRPDEQEALRIHSIKRQAKGRAEARALADHPDGCARAHIDRGQTGPRGAGTEIAGRSIANAGKPRHAFQFGKLRGQPAVDGRRLITDRAELRGSDPTRLHQLRIPGEFRGVEEAGAGGHGDRAIRIAGERDLEPLRG